MNLRLAVERIAEHCSAGGRAIRALHVEDAIPDLQPYLDRDGLSLQQRDWDAAFEETLLGIGDSEGREGGGHTFLGMHMPHYRKDKFFPIPTLRHFVRYGPDVIITLIDDVHTCYERIRRRPRTRSNFTLRDILIWRSLSVYAGDFVASALREAGSGRRPSNYMVAVKHPLRMFERLLFEPGALRAYCSFSITGLRADAGRRAAVDRFRARMHERFCVFDPLTIEDRLCQNRLEEITREGGEGAADPSGTITLTGSERWGLGEGFSAVDDRLDGGAGAPSIFPMEIPVREILEVASAKETPQGRDPSVTDNLIRERDFRLIDQSDTVVVYRPNIAGRVSGGVAHEAAYASQVGLKTWYYYWPPEDGPMGGGPFAQLAGAGIPYEDEDALVADLEKRAAGKRGGSAGRPPGDGRDGR